MHVAPPPHTHTQHHPPKSRPRLSPRVVCDRDVECVCAATLRPSWRALNLYRFPFPRPICCSISGAAPCKHATPLHLPPHPLQCNAISPINSSGFSQRRALDKRALPSRARSLTLEMWRRRRFWLETDLRGSPSG